MAAIPFVPALSAGVAADVTCDQLVDLFWFYGAAASVFRPARKIGNVCQSILQDEDVREPLQETPLNVKGYICPSRPQGTILEERPGECRQPSQGSQPCANIDIAQQCAHSVSSMRWLRRVFDTFDENKDGLLSLEELRRSFEKLGLESSNAHCLLRDSRVSSAQKGAFSQDEFLLLYHGVSCTQCVPQDTSDDSNAGSMDSNKDDAEEELIWDAFNIFDKDKDGFISPSELQSVLCGLGFGAARELDACIEMIRRYDQDGNGQVDFEEFKDMLNSAIKLS